MAKFTPGAIISEIRNKIAATVFTKNASGNSIRNRSTPINPRSTKQGLRRQILASLSAQWRGLTQAQRDGWNNGASNFPQSDSLGQTVILTGAQLFVRSNANLILIGAAQITTIPVPASFAVLAIGASTMAAGVLTIAFTVTPVPAGFNLVVRATAPVSQGKQFISESAFRFLQVLAPAAATPIVGTVAYAAAFGSAPAAGTKIFVSIQLVQISSGLASQVVRREIIAT